MLCRAQNPVWRHARSSMPDVQVAATVSVFRRKLHMPPQDNSMGITWTLCWWGMNYSPGDVVNRVHSLLPVRMVTKVSGSRVMLPGYTMALPSTESAEEIERTVLAMLPI